jgi:hypothetical protein
MHFRMVPHMFLLDEPFFPTLVSQETMDHIFQEGPANDSQRYKKYVLNDHIDEFKF